MNTVKTSKAKRIISIDVMRGIIIAIMLLDHSREFFSFYKFSPTDLAQTTPALFFTRWITNYCAPIFVFLAGTGAFLFFLSRGKSVPKTSFFLFSRGLSLLFIELVLVRFAASFNFDYYNDSAANVCQVIWAIGWSMIVLSLLVRFSHWAVATFGILMISLHNLLDGIGPHIPTDWRWLYIILHERGSISVAPGLEFMMAYPLVPWIGVMAVGYAFGSVAIMDEPKRKKCMLWLGVGMVLAFITLRIPNLYGDPNPWVFQHNYLFTLFSILNTTKYPPSLLFLLMTIGPMLILLAFFKEKNGLLSKVFLAFGSVPMFFYLMHIFLLHLVALLMASIRYKSFPNWIFFGNPIFNVPPYPLGPEDYGYNLLTVYLVWFTSLIILYPICNWYMKYKRSHNHFWLSYL